MKLNEQQLDRAIGAILASAAGDALGAPYEFKPPISLDTAVEMKVGGSFGWAPGEWTDDTSMAIPILQVLARGHSLADEATQDAIVNAWRQWAKTAPDVGIQTRAVLAALRGPTAATARESAKTIHQQTGRSGGNGSLMRTAPVALSALDSAEHTSVNARAISELTHLDEDAGDACVLWSEAIRTAILTGGCQIRDGLYLLPEARRNLWIERIQSAEEFEPVHFENNGWVVSAFQAAWSAVYRAESIQDGLERAVRAGNDTDTVAAIAGGILGAWFGASRLPRE
jgi:ADP-ribosylglycohydrolase